MDTVPPIIPYYRGLLLLQAVSDGNTFPLHVSTGSHPTLDWDAGLLIRTIDYAVLHDIISFVLPVYCKPWDGCVQIVSY